jgi:hypothetical protein
MYIYHICDQQYYPSYPDLFSQCASVLHGPAKAEVAAMGSMPDDEVATWFRTSDMMKRVQEKTGMILEDIFNGRPITGKCRLRKESNLTFT